MRWTTSMFFILIMMFTAFVKLHSDEQIDLDSLDEYQVWAIIEGNVFAYFAEETSQYNTDLKKKVFLTTDEGIKLLNQLKEYKKLVLSHRFSKVLDSEKFSLGEYDIKNSGFYLSLTSNFGQGTFDAQYPRSILGFCMDSLSITKQPFFGSDQFVWYQTFLPITEAAALKIEGNANIEIRIEFNVTNNVTRQYEFYEMGNAQLYTITQKMPNATNIVFVISDSSNNEVLAKLAIKNK